MSISGKPVSKDAHEDVESKSALKSKESHHAHEEYTDRQLEDIHDRYGLAGQSYLILPVENQEMEERGIDVANHIEQHVTSFTAPFTVDRLLGANRDADVKVVLGKNSNIQEIGRLEADKNQKISIKIGNNSSLAHGVNFSFDDGDETASCKIGNDVFVGISTRLGDCEIKDNTGIGFNVIVESGVSIGERSVVCDGSIIQRGVEIPSFCIVTPGSVVSRDIVENKILSPEEYGKLNTEGRRTANNLIRFTGEQQKMIIEAESKTKGGGSKMSRDLLQQAGVDASSLFLSTFNEIVVEENRLFPLIYRLVHKFHPEHVKMIRDDVMVVDLPLDRHAFLKHYFKAMEVSEGEPAIYDGPFTSCNIDGNVDIEGKAVLIGNIDISGNKFRTKIGQYFCCRGDEMGATERVRIEDSEIGENVTVHASGDKLVKNAFVDDKSVIHGKTGITGTERTKSDYSTRVGRNVTVHAVNVSDSILKSDSIILGANVDNCTIGRRNTIIGHAVPGNSNSGQISLKNVNTAERVTIARGNVILGDERLGIGRKTVVRENSKISGSGKIKDHSLIKPDSIIGIEGSLFVDARTEDTDEGGNEAVKSQTRKILDKISRLEETAVAGPDVLSTLEDVRKSLGDLLDGLKKK